MERRTPSGCLKFDHHPTLTLFILARALARRAVPSWSGCTANPSANPRSARAKLILAHRLGRSNKSACPALERLALVSSRLVVYHRSLSLLLIPLSLQSVVHSLKKNHPPTEFINSTSHPSRFSPTCADQIRQDALLHLHPRPVRPGRRRHREDPGLHERQAGPAGRHQLQGPDRRLLRRARRGRPHRGLHRLLRLRHRAHQLRLQGPPDCTSNSFMSAHAISELTQLTSSANPPSPT